MRNVSCCNHSFLINIYPPFILLRNIIYRWVEATYRFVSMPICFIFFFKSSLSNREIIPNKVYASTRIRPREIASNVTPYLAVDKDIFNLLFFTVGFYSGFSLEDWAVKINSTCIFTVLASALQSITVKFLNFVRWLTIFSLSN